MKVKQILWPSSSLSLSDVVSVQIGVQRPHNIPLDFIENSPLAIVRISHSSSGGQAKTYALTDRETVEYANVRLTNLVIDILEQNPYVIVDVAWKGLES